MTVLNTETSEVEKLGVFDDGKGGGDGDVRELFGAAEEGTEVGLELALGVAEDVDFALGNALHVASKTPEAKGMAKIVGLM